jgi:hypothetical protein
MPTWARRVKEKEKKAGSRGDRAGHKIKMKLFPGKICGLLTVKGNLEMKTNYHSIYLAKDLTKK